MSSANAKQPVIKVERFSSFVLNILINFIQAYKMFEHAVGSGKADKIIR